MLRDERRADSPSLSGPDINRCRSTRPQSPGCITLINADVLDTMLEQRNGRIIRIGSQHDRVRLINLTVRTLLTNAYDK